METHLIAFQAHESIRVVVRDGRRTLTSLSLPSVALLRSSLVPSLWTALDQPRSYLDLEVASAPVDLPSLAHSSILATHPCSAFDAFSSSSSSSSSPTEESNSTAPYSLTAT